MAIKQQDAVIIVVDEFMISGITTFLHSYSQYLRSIGLKVILLGRSKNDAWVAQKFQGCVIYTFAHADATGSLGSVIKTYIQNSFRYAALFRTACKQHRVVAVHFNQVLSAFSILLFSSSVYKYKRIYTFHGDRAQELQSEHIRHPVRTLHIAVMQHLQRFVLRRCSVVVAVSRYGLNRLRELKITHTQYIPNGLYMDAHDAALPKTNNNRPNKTFNCVNISRFEPRKGHILLLNALHLLLEKKTQIETTIVGPVACELLPILYEYERLKIGAHVHFCHETDARTVEQFLRNADLFIVPSVALENCPFTIIEAFAHGIPVVGTPVGGIPEMLKKVDSRLIAKRARPDSLAETIHWYMRLPVVQKQAIQKACKITAQKYYNAAINYKKYVRLYRVT